MKTARANRNLLIEEALQSTRTASEKIVQPGVPRGPAFGGRGKGNRRRRAPPPPLSAQPKARRRTLIRSGGRMFVDPESVDETPPDGDVFLLIPASFPN
jgi:hypothetical protein